MVAWILSASWTVMLLCWSIPRVRDSLVCRVVTVGTTSLAGLNYVLWLRIARFDQDDFHTYYRAAQQLLHGRDLYAGGTGFVAHGSVASWATGSPYVYPPLFAALVSPFTAIPLYRAGELWILLLTLMIATLILVLVATLQRSANVYTLLPLSVAVLSIVPVRADVLFGQADLPVGLLIVLILLAYQRQHDVCVGVLLGVAIAIKPQMALYGVFLVRKRCWKSLLIGAGTGLILGLGPFVLMGGESLAHWVTIAQYWSSGSFTAWPVNQSARALLLRAFVGGPTNTPLLHSQPLADVIWVLVDILALTLWWRRVNATRYRNRRVVVEFALTTSLILFAAPLSENVNYVTIVILLSVMIDRLIHSDRFRWWAASAIAACVYFTIPGLDSDAWGGDGHLGSLLQSGTFLYGLIYGAALLLSVRLEETDVLAPRPLPPARTTLTLKSDA